jgi:3-hydroxymyristoyl/3-hydroxydecanoyl-(acyl carrier protein) dehydratase
MIEVAAQLSSYLAHRMLGDDRFIGLTGVDAVKFRGTVIPPARFVIVGQGLELRIRRIRCAVQGFVGGTMVFEAMITGMAV